jgi:hypothetical protein
MEQVEQFYPALGTNFLKYIVDMGSDGGLGDSELESDFLVGQTLGNQIGHLPFPRSE